MTLRWLPLKAVRSCYKTLQPFEPRKVFLVPVEITTHSLAATRQPWEQTGKYSPPFYNLLFFNDLILGTAFALRHATNVNLRSDFMYQEQSIDLIWDESSPIDTSVMALLTKAGFKPQSMGAAEVAQYVEQNGFGPCVLCMHRRELPNIEMIRTLKQHYGSKIYLVLRVAPGDLDSTVEAIKCGVDDVISDGDDQLHRWEKIAGSPACAFLRTIHMFLLTKPASIYLRLVERVGAAEVTALMCGPTGSGKEVLARLTHDFSPRRDGPFIPVNCAALPESLAESFLFGHAKGAFTGATKSTDGFFTQAQGGTLFLDEIGELTLASARQSYSEPFKRKRYSRWAVQCPIELMCASLQPPTEICALLSVTVCSVKTYISESVPFELMCQAYQRA